LASIFGIRLHHIARSLKNSSLKTGQRWNDLSIDPPAND